MRTGGLRKDAHTTSERYERIADDRGCVIDIRSVWRRVTKARPLLYGTGLQ